MLASEWVEERSVAELPAISDLAHPRLPDAADVLTWANEQARLIRTANSISSTTWAKATSAPASSTWYDLHDGSGGERRVGRGRALVAAAHIRAGLVDVGILDTYFIDDRQ